MSKHTPGPWRNEHDFASICKDNQTLARLYYGEGRSEFESEANAKLMAAAPEMLEALEAIVEHAKSMQDAWDTDGNQPNTKMHGLAVCLNNRAGDLIEKAIAKAKGETP